ncbi:MAG: hypothetical protein ACYSR3_09465 [Planctomycetota bacterium]|jgi:peptidoglycan biosynthesis protein MviN/MurJ (putative lipid II flippase)
MSLRKATLIALISVVVYTILSLFWFLYNAVMNLEMHGSISSWVNLLFWASGIVLFNGSIIFFLAVLHSKQKE